MMYYVVLQYYVAWFLALLVHLLIFRFCVCALSYKAEAHHISGVYFELEFPYSCFVLVVFEKCMQLFFSCLAICWIKYCVLRGENNISVQY
jgi:hypothetical protein